MKFFGRNGESIVDTNESAIMERIFMDQFCEFQEFYLFEDHLDLFDVRRA